MLIIFQAISLIEHLQQTFQPVAHPSFQIRDLHDDAVVRQAFDKPVRHPFSDKIRIIVQVITPHVDNRLLQISQLMSQDVNGDKRKPVSIGIVMLRQNVPLIEILDAEILAEAQRLGAEPRFLQLDEDQVLGSIGVADNSGEINPVKRDLRALGSRKLMRAHLQTHNLLLQQSRQQDFRDAVVFHHVFEHRIINRVCNDRHGRNELKCYIMQRYSISGNKASGGKKNVASQIKLPDAAFIFTGRSFFAKRHFFRLSPYTRFFKKLRNSGKQGRKTA